MADGDVTRPDDGGERPAFDATLGAEEFSRWYWTRAELVEYARILGISTAGSKVRLSERVCAALAGEQLVEPTPARRYRLSPPIDDDTVLPGAVVLTRELREWFIGRVGPEFRANTALRAFLSNGGGRRLGEALEVYLAGRSRRGSRNPTPTRTPPRGGLVASQG
jgi:hypothetical protein